MAVAASIILAAGIVFGCKSTKFPATNDEKNYYRATEDLEYDHPTEKDYDRNTGKGGGKR